MRTILLICILYSLSSNILHAQCKIYSGKYASGQPVAVFKNGKLYAGRQSSGQPIANLEGDKAYSGRYAQGKPIANLKNSKSVFLGPYATGKAVCSIKESKIYSGPYPNSGNVIGMIENGGQQCAFAAAVYLRIL